MTRCFDELCKFFFFNIFMRITYWYILVFVDRFIKMKHLIFIVIIKTKKIVQVFYVNVWKYYDLSKSFTFDRDTQFIFDIFKHFCQMLKIDVRLFITYHFEIDEQTKRFNVVIKYYFRIFCNYMQNDWIKWLFNAKFFVNNVSFVNILVSSFLINCEQNSRLNFEFFVFFFQSIWSFSFELNSSMLKILLRKWKNSSNIFATKCLSFKSFRKLMLMLIDVSIFDI